MVQSFRDRYPLPWSVRPIPAPGYGIYDSNGFLVLPLYAEAEDGWRQRAQADQHGGGEGAGRADRREAWSFSLRRPSGAAAVADAQVMVEWWRRGAR